jgi:phosphoglycolate phosphatase (TIGR01487 family)
MRYVALASDYDGTLAHHGMVNDETAAAVQKLRQSGRKFILVTGRMLEDLETVFGHFDLADRIVAENGAVMYTPSTREKAVLAAPPQPGFVDALRRRGVHPIGVGDAIVATWHPNETIVLEVIRDLGLDLQLIFNKGAVMILPSGVNKRSGLQAALTALGISEHNIAGIGDAENDHAFLECCEFSAAVANAHPAVKDRADLVTAGSQGEGVIELIDAMLRDDLSEQSAGARMITIGREGPNEIDIPAYGRSLLVSGASGSGKSTFVAGLVELLIKKGYQMCLVDPEGDYHGFAGMIPVGDEKHAPSVDEVLQLLQAPGRQVVVSLVGIAVAERPTFLAGLLPRLQEMRLRMGRPHWIVVDEAHHMLPPDLAPSPAQLTGELGNLMLITGHPDHLAADVLRTVNAVFAVGPNPEKVIEVFANAVGVARPPLPSASLATGQALAWFVEKGAVHRFDIQLARAERKRHMRNYAYGELGEDRSFYFRGSEQKLNLRAQNLMLFLQIADGIDDDTWSYHLKRGDYSRWFREGIKDEGLADEAAGYGGDEGLSAVESRGRIRGAVEKRYTAAA